MSEDSDAFEEYKTIKVGELATREAVDIRQQIPVVACVFLWLCTPRIPYVHRCGIGLQRREGWFSRFSFPVFPRIGIK